jgi:hypothetical protein
MLGQGDKAALAWPLCRLIHAGSSAKGKFDIAKKLQRHLLQLLPRPLGKATNAIARAKRGASLDTRAKSVMPAEIVSPTSTSVELLAGGCVATDPTQPAWREGARTPDR